MIRFLRGNLLGIVDSEINFDSFTKISSLFFRAVLFDFYNPLQEDASYNQKLVYHLKMNYFRLCLLGLVSEIMSLIMFGIVNWDDFLVAAVSVPNTLTAILIGLKALSTLFHRKDILKIFQELRTTFETYDNENNTSRIKDYLDRYQRSMKFYSAPFLIMLVHIGSPVISYLVFGEMTIHLDVWFPFDAFQPTTFPFAFIWVCWIAWNSILMLLATDSLLYALVTVVLIEFHNFTSELNEIKLLKENEKISKLRSLTDRHGKILEISDKLQNIYDMSFLGTFFVSSFLMCFLGFIISTAGQSLATIFLFVPFLISMFGQILLLCWFGQKLIDSSLAVADSAYGCGWEDFADNKLKRQLILIIMRAQKPNQLSAMKFAGISLNSFATVSSYLH